MFQPMKEGQNRARNLVQRAGYKIGGSDLTSHADVESDRRMIKKAFGEHDTQQHGGKRTRLHFANGGMASDRLDKRPRGGGKQPHHGTQVNIAVMPNKDNAGANRPPMPAAPPPAAPPRPPMMPPRPPMAGPPGPPPGAGPGGPPPGAIPGPMAGPPGAIPPRPPMPPPGAGMRPPGMASGGMVDHGTENPVRPMRKRGGYAKGGNLSSPEEMPRAKAVFAKGGGIHMDAGALSGEGRLEKAAQLKDLGD